MSHTQRKSNNNPVRGATNKQTKSMARHGMLSILSKEAPVSDCVQLQEIITNTRSCESEIRFKGLLRLVEDVWETSSQISGEYMATPT
jgi:hypothetical protein